MMRRVSKAEWLQKALALLDVEGVEAIRVERLARELNVSKSGFYWHFKDREDLRSQMIDFWVHEFNEVVFDNPALRESDPKKRLEETMIMLLDHDLTRYEVAMQAWAQSDPAIARRVGQVYRKRLDFLRGIFSDLGFEEDELEMRARLVLCHGTWERTMFPRESKKSLRKMIRPRVNLLAKK